ncbi:MAG: bifunctional riboflavin kinase/FAD synthetase [Chloroflexi bacterium]|nr:bifunctional riboflavin kinase/FAD synthetase [Chloroflexota bacterium]
MISNVEIIQDLSQLQAEREMVLTVGVFDGVHLGHQKLIHRVQREAQKASWDSGVVTFHPHPRRIISPRKELLCLTPLEERARLLRGMGVKQLIVLAFTPELRQLTARQFISILVERLKMRALVTGPDFALGRGREGDLAYLQELGRETGFSVFVESPVEVKGVTVSSSAVRAALAAGDVERVAQLLGRNFLLRGQVVGGEQRGVSLGFATANIVPAPQQALPADGVYIARAWLWEGKYSVFKAVTNIGVRPTFGGGQRGVETHLLDFQGDLYSKELFVELVRRVRDEIRFASVEDLKTQIARDVAQARATLSS